MKTENEILQVLEDKSFDLQDLCRICLNECMEEKFSIYEPDDDSEAAYNDIMSISKVIFTLHEENLPSFMCKDCKKELSVATSFRIQCENSDGLLRRILLKNDVCNEATEIIELKQEQNLLDDDIKIDLKNEGSVEPSVVVLKKKLKKVKKKTIQTVSQQQIITNNECDVILDKIKEEFDNDFDFNDTAHYSDDNDFMENHDDSKKLKKHPCKVCNKLLKSKRSLMNHMFKYHKDDQTNKTCVPYKIEGFGVQRKYLCAFCKFTAKRKQGIMGHVRTHTGEKPFRCDECKMHFPTSSALCNHKKVHSDQMNHTCPQCGKQFRMKSKYEIHKSVHTTEKKYQCHICNKRLKSKVTLQIHMFRHSNIKNYSCEACGATFVTCSELISHSKSHGGEKKFKCSICTFMTVTKAALDAHLLRHTGERKFECKQCDTKCFTVAALRNHMIKHTKEKRYSCLFCEQRFAHSSSLNRHMFKSHEEKRKWMDLVDRRVVK